MRGAKTDMSRLVVGVLLLGLAGSAAADTRTDASRCSDADAAYKWASTYLAREPDQAIALFRRAAIAGHAKAQEAFARQLDYGFNIPRSPIGAYIWYSIAARAAAGPASSWSDACLTATDFSDRLNIGWRVTHRRDELASMLSAGDLSVANRAAENWKPGTSDPTQITTFGENLPPEPQPPANRLPHHFDSGRQPKSSEMRPGGEEIEIQKRGNSYTVPVRINETITLPFVLDTGAEVLVIPADVALTLIRAGALTSGDFVGKGRYSLANGSEEVSDRVIIREVKVGQHTVRNVTAIVNPPASDLLLGQSFLSKFGKVTLDYNRLVLVLAP
jgi:aspartyl protease family protein